MDSSVWIDHLRRGDAILTDLLNREVVVTHPFIIGELATGNLRPRAEILTFLQNLDRVIVAHDDEVLRFIEDEHLFGLGVGYVDAHLLASVRLTPDTSLWTRDKRLLSVADRLSLAARLT